MVAHLVRIDLYPVKSLAGTTVTTAQLLASGALAGDRAYALFDQQGRFVNAKRYAQIHQVRSRVDETLQTLSLWTDATETAMTFDLEPDRAALAAWFSDYFGEPIHLRQNDVMGFPDDTDSPGPTVISTATLQTVADWFGLSLMDCRQRFRTNLEIGGVPAFWEDQLFSESGDPVPFQIGAVSLQGINPCQRCIVPTRDPATGQPFSGFQKRFTTQRADTLPTTVARSRFNHFYRLAVNTRSTGPGGQTLTVGDRVALG
ncbi:MAG: MOSC N-terminal beta barrel domain-containing protein [Cyanobacteria bacterium]|nr:MOSC N-terminal beta barrel domain-containing protein [Cyanobacteriota bacterium]